jgi:nitroreductase
VYRRLFEMGQTMDVIDAIHSRRSVRAYEAREPDRTLLEAVIWDAAQAPPPARANLPSWLFAVVVGQAKLAALGERAKQHAREHRPPGKGAWVDDPNFKIFWDAPALIVIGIPADHPDAAFDCHRAGQNLMLSAHARGLGTCWVGSPMGWLKTLEGKTAVGIPSDYEAIAPICIGYARETPALRRPDAPNVVWNA